MKTDHLLVLSTESYAYLGDAVAAAGPFERGAVARKRFPDGERYQRIEGGVADRHVAIVGGTIGDSDTLELFDLACAVTKYGAQSLTLVIPYYGYSTMERAALPGEVVTAKTRARLFSAVPSAAVGNRIVLLDLHVEALSHYFEGGTQPVHLYAKPIVHAAARRLGGDDFVLACTDAGRAKWVEGLANELGVPASFVFKRRLDGARTEVTAVSAHVQGKRVVIYDDMIRTGGSLTNAAAAYRDAGAASVCAVATHGLFPGDALERIRKSGLLDGLVTTDSHPRALALAGDAAPFLTVESVAGLLAGYLRGGSA